jgi:hypothetical protein
MTPRTFTATLDSLRFGTLADELTDKLRDLTATCASTGRAGSLTLTLQLKPGKGGQIEVFDEVKLKLPKEEKGSSLMFATPENFLQREDPRQLTLEGLRVAGAPAASSEPLRTANGA